MLIKVTYRNNWLPKDYNETKIIILWSRKAKKMLSQKFNNNFFWWWDKILKFIKHKDIIPDNNVLKFEFNRIAGFRDINSKSLYRPKTNWKTCTFFILTELKII